MLIASYFIMYLYFYHVIFNETVLKQRANVELNRKMTANFFKSVFHIAVQIVSDKSMEGHLSCNCTDPLETIQMWQTIKAQFAHYATHQGINNACYYKNTLFL